MFQLDWELMWLVSRMSQDRGEAAEGQSGGVAEWLIDMVVGVV